MDRTRDQFLASAGFAGDQHTFNGAWATRPMLRNKACIAGVSPISKGTSGICVR